MYLSKFTKINSLATAWLVVFLCSCSDKKQANPEIEKVAVDFKIERFDQLFFETPDSELPAVKKQFPYLFPSQVDDAFWLSKKSDTLFVELHDEVQKQYRDLGSLPEELKGLFQHIKYYFPEQNTAKVVTVISEVDVTSKAIYADSLALISLDAYLGAEHRFYQGFATYLRSDFQRSQILPDLAQSFLASRISPPADRSFLEAMIYSGKTLYAKGQLLPEAPRESLINYTSAQWNWCESNEVQIWSYFVEDKLLYSTDSKLQTRFIQPSPFSKFYLDIDAESPGRVGMWIGWQIVDSYMKNNNVTLQQLLQTQAKEIFEKSRYKPKK